MSVAQGNVAGRSRKRLPPWLRKPLPPAGRTPTVVKHVEACGLHTVCREARCPNRIECFSRGTATFLIMGDTCSRACRFCGVAHGSPAPLDPREPERVCESVRKLTLSYVVVTSVTRDDLPDGGSAHFAATVRALKAGVAGMKVEVLIPDFGGSEHALGAVLDSGPDVVNHNVETVPRLYERIRPQADYQRSLSVLRNAASYGRHQAVKSGLMVGLGEREDEVVSVLHDLRECGCSLVTIGQYLQPTDDQVPVEHFVTPRQFGRYEMLGLEMGFSRVFAGPFVRSSYRASELFGDAAGPRPRKVTAFAASQTGG